MSSWTSLYRYIPAAWREALEGVPPALQDRVQEVRLRCGAPLMLTTVEGNAPLDVLVTAEEIRDCFWRLCGQAVHAHETELSQGFVTTAEGLRVGVAGTAVIKHGLVTAYRDITSLCIRLPRVVRAAATPLLPYVQLPHGVNSLLLCGPPASGKTTVLRDLAQSLSATKHVAVVDERCELSLGDLSRCDVLKACPKSVGILQAVRVLSPEAVVVDELGEEAEWKAVMHSCFCGVAVIASVHAQSVEDLLARRALHEAILNDAFALVALLPSRGDVFGETRIWKARDLVENGGGLVGRVRLRGDGSGGVGDASQAGEIVGSVDATLTEVASGTALFRAAV